MQVANALHLRSDLHLIRKFWHMTTGGAGLMAYWSFELSHRNAGAFLLIFSIASFIFEYTRLKSPKVNEFVMKFMGVFMRESERNSVSGMPFYAMGCGLSLLLCSENIAILSILFLIFSDPISSMAGVVYGKDKILPNKSIQGSMAGFLICYFLTLGFGYYHIGASLELVVFALIGGVIGSFSELLSIFVDDNLTIPVVSGLGLTALNNVIPLF